MRVEDSQASSRWAGYAGNTGIWVLWFQQDFPPQHYLNDRFHMDRAIKLAQVIDGTSNTIPISERAHSTLDDSSERRRPESTQVL
jgi:hypothetical protein